MAAGRATQKNRVNSSNAIPLQQSNLISIGQANPQQRWDQNFRFAEPIYNAWSL